MNNSTIKPEMKACSKCGIEKPFNNHYYAKDNRTKSGLRSVCKDCNKRYKGENKEQINRYLKEYHAQNKGSISDRKKRYYQDNKEQILTYSKKYQKDNASKVREYKRRYKRENRDIFNHHNQKRRTLKQNLPSSLTKEQWINIKYDFDYRCAYCGIEGDLQQEHFIPLSKGGEFTRNNIIPACIRCNGSKGNKDFFEWYPKQEYYSTQREQQILKYLNYNKNKEQQLALL